MLGKVERVFLFFNGHVVGNICGAGRQRRMRDDNVRSSSRTSNRLESKDYGSRKVPASTIIEYSHS